MSRDSFFSISMSEKAEPDCIEHWYFQVSFVRKSWVCNIISSLMVWGCNNVVFNFTSLIIVDIAHSGFLYQGPLHNWHSFHYKSKLSTSQKNKRNFCIRITLRNVFNQSRVALWLVERGFFFWITTFRIWIYKLNLALISGNFISEKLQ